MIYPTNREFFGSEANPGVDNDPHIFVLYAGELGQAVGGYYNESDVYNPLVNEYSNAHDVYVMLNAQPLDDPYAYATLAHEFVHMIQNASDRNDVNWLNEGFAEVGAFLNGYGGSPSEWMYVADPDLQLNSWADNTSPDFSRHYGQSSLYLTYFLDRFGTEPPKRCDGLGQAGHLVKRNCNDCGGHAIILSIAFLGALNSCLLTP